MAGGDKKKKKTTGGFESLGLSPNVYRGVMAMGYKVPTPIQRKALPMVLSDRDVVAMARTGSGKTAAFLIPMLEKLKEHSVKSGARAVILSPTRELATQTIRFAKSLAKFTSLRCILIVGGDSMEQQFELLSQNPDVIVATPGRLMHHLQEIPGFTLATTEYLVFDEADRMFEMGFAEQLNEIIKSMPDSRQTLLFSATLPKALAQFARAGLSNPELIRLDLESKISEKLKVAFFTMHSGDKPAVFLYLIRDFIPQDQQTIVFAATRHHVEFLHAVLLAAGIESSCVYGDMDQTSRKINIGKFRAKKTNILLVTDVAARGIDIPLLDNVLNYSFPPTPKLFVHRVGRAARAGRCGTAFNFVDPDEVPYMVDLHLYLGRKLEDSLPKSSDDSTDTEKSMLQYSLSSMSVNDVHYGTLPRDLIDVELEHFKELLAQNNHIEPLMKVCENAYKLYSKTRSDPSKQSIQRGKTVNFRSFHPLFTEHMNADAVDKASYLEQLQQFRPSQTIFEVSTGTKSFKKTSPTVVMMSSKRKEHQRAIKNEVQVIESTLVSPETPQENTGVKRKAPQLQMEEEPVAVKRRLSKAERKALKKGVDRDQLEADAEKKKAEKLQKLEQTSKVDENFISYMKDEDRVMEGAMMNNDEGRMNKMTGARLEEAMLDVNPDEAVAMNDRKRVMHWDAKKKKFIKASVKDIRKGSVNKRNESGARVKGDKIGDIYKKWQQKNNKRVNTAGEEESGPALDYRNGRKPALSKSAANKPDGRVPRNELLDEHSIRKEEKRKARSSGNKPTKKKPTKRGKGNIAGKSHGAPTRSKRIIRK